MKITQYDDTYSQRLGSGETTLDSGASGGSNSGFPYATLSVELIGDGSTNEFDIGVVYVTGTLIVFVAGINVNDDLTETDPTAGLITLAFVPELGERITVLGR